MEFYTEKVKKGSVQQSREFDQKIHLHFNQLA